MIYKRPAIFLDRDGVLIENRDSYIRGWSDVTFYPMALKALVAIAGKEEYAVVIVTNQSAVGRGILSLDEARGINDEVVKFIHAHQGRVDATYMCPHDPSDCCACRKPEPGLLFQAAEELAIDLPRSCMVGDALSDVIAGRAAGLRANYLVRTGRGLDQLARATATDLHLFSAVDDLAAAVEIFMNLP